MNNIESLKKYMFRKERMEELQTETKEKVIIQMPRSKPPPLPTDYEELPKAVSEIETALSNQPQPQPQFNEVLSKKPFVEDKNVLDTSFFPKEKDKLFWCFYIMRHGLEEYQALGKTNVVIEKKIKIEYIELLRTKKQLLKAHKMAPLTHIENELLNEPKIDLKTFLALCVCDNLPMIYVHKKTYYALSLDDSVSDSVSGTEKFHIITRFDEPLKYGYRFGTKDCVKSFYKIDNLNKPLRALSAYKLDELMDMCHKLGMTTIKKQTKQEMYEFIVQQL
jgi:hypothetical protein